VKHLDKQNLKLRIDCELKSYRREFVNRNFDLAFRHLERVHIVSQPFPIEHTLIHLRMLNFAVRTFRPFEILVQFIYSLFSFKFSLLKIFPQGNTGGASAITKGAMTIPNDLLEEIIKAN
jgi:hypothetical protein